MLRRKTYKTTVSTRTSPKKLPKLGSKKSLPRNMKVKKGKRDDVTVVGGTGDDEEEEELIETKEYDFRHISEEDLEELWHRLAIITLHFQPTETWYASIFGEKKIPVPTTL
jgi:hypothetical protein